MKTPQTRYFNGNHRRVFKPFQHKVLDLFSKISMSKVEEFIGKNFILNLILIGKIMKILVL
jgi:hypothetical protein